jgi:hypothetical protein
VSEDHLYLRDPNSVGGVADYKSAARRDIEREPSLPRGLTQGDLELRENR